MSRGIIGTPVTNGPTSRSVVGETGNGWMYLVVRCMIDQPQPQSRIFYKKIPPPPSHVLRVMSTRIPHLKIVEGTDYLALSKIRH